MNYNCIYFHLEKLQLGPIDAAFQKLPEKKDDLHKQTQVFVLGI